MTEYEAAELALAQAEAALLDGIREIVTDLTRLEIQAGEILKQLEQHA